MPFFFYPVLNALNDGKLIRSLVGVALRILAALWILAGIYLLIEMLKIAFRLENEGTIGGLLFAVIFVGTVLSVAQIFWYRAGSVDDLRDSPFTVIPIVSILLRTLGESYATLGAAIGVGGCLFIWFAKNNPMWLLGGLGGLLPRSSPEMTFLGGLSFLVYAGLTSFMALILFYFLAESSLVLVEIAQQTRRIGAEASAGGPQTRLDRSMATNVSASPITEVTT